MFYRFRHTFQYRLGKDRTFWRRLLSVRANSGKSFKRLCPIEALLPFDAESLCHTSIVARIGVAIAAV